MGLKTILREWRERDKVYKLKFGDLELWKNENVEEYKIWLTERGSRD